ncbi:MAG: hypothetical protein ACR2OD_01980 [Gaiellaceae bacterium]
MAATRSTELATRPAFYALARGGWRDYVTLLHLPYTAWHLSYVTVGATLASSFDVGRWGATMLAFFLAVGIGAHALDELHGRPLRTQISSRVLVGLATASVAGAIAIGAAASVYFTPWIAAFVLAGSWLVLAYNLELWRGIFHSDAWFALAWGGFPVLCAYFAQAESLGVEALLASAFATSLALAQRRLSTAVRRIRREVHDVRGELENVDGTTTPISTRTITAPAEHALQLLSVAVVLLALALLLSRLA